jgi:hypothetical protein
MVGFAGAPAKGRSPPRRPADPEITVIVRLRARKSYSRSKADQPFRVDLAFGSGLEGFPLFYALPFKGRWDALPG